MNRQDNKTDCQKGVALILVLSSLLIVTILANIVLSIILNQGRLTRHTVSRLQGYYAAQMGLVYAMENLKSGLWPIPAVGTAEIRYISRNCAFNPSRCTTELNLPFSINNVTIRMTNTPVSGISRIDSSADYTYTYANP